MSYHIYEAVQIRRLEKDERFHFLVEESLKPSHRTEAYYPIRLLKSYSLDELPPSSELSDDLEAERASLDILETVRDSGAVKEVPFRPGSYSDDLKTILKNPKVLPLLVGLDEDLNEMVSKYLKEA